VVVGGGGEDEEDEDKQEGEAGGGAAWASLHGPDGPGDPATRSSCPTLPK
jgi:hypothetical protein